MTNRAEQTRYRVNALQDYLRRENMDGIFVPRTDFWQGEEVMACDERLRWLTGFTGSAGFALVLQDRAALFVDGRYTVQAPTELAGSGVDIRHVVDEPWKDYLPQKSGLRLAVDGKLVTADWAKAVRQILGHAGELVALESNPIDTIWEDQPRPNFTPVEIFPLELSGETSLSKRERLGRELARRQLDAAFITDPTGIAWLLNIRAHDYEHTPVALSVALLRADGSVTWYTDITRALPDVMAHVGGKADVQSPAHFVQNARAFAGQRLLLDEATVSLWMHETLTAAGAAITMAPCIAIMAKAAKNKVEIDGMRAAHRRDGVALAKFLAWFAADVAGGTASLMESQIMDRLASSRATANEYRGASFATICGWGASGAIVHYHTTQESDAVVAGNGLLLLDSGGQYVDGTTDVTRTIAIGTPTEEQRQNFTRVLKGHVALGMAKFPAGSTGHQLDALARNSLWQAGLNYDHGTGHGVGHYLSVHEGPQRISTPKNHGLVTVLQPGMVISNEPGYYKTGAYGIRIENLITVIPSDIGQDGRDFLEFETLTLAPYDRKLIVVDMLTPEERAWVDAYHARVLKEIAPQTDAVTQGWLEMACRPL